MRRVHILDPQLRGNEGHYLNHDLQLAADLRRRGVDVRVYGHRNVTPDVTAALDARPTFTDDLFAEASTEPWVWALDNFDVVNRRFLGDLAAIDAAALGPDDLLYFPNILQNQIAAVADWLAAMPPAGRPRVALMLRWLNHDAPYVRCRTNRDMIPLLYRHAVRRLCAAQPRAVVCADTEALANAYRQILDRDVLLLPNPMDLSEFARPDGPAARGGRPKVAYLGHTSRLRGVHLVPDVIAACRGATPEPRFVAQFKPGPDLTDVARQLAGIDPGRLTLVDGVLTRADYIRLLEGADIVLLPYDPAFYATGSSGVFAEALSLGKVIVTTAGTVAADDLTRFGAGGVVAQRFDAPAVADALLAAVADVDALTAKSRRAAPRWREYHCAATFWDHLLAATAARSH